MELDSSTSGTGLADANNSNEISVVRCVNDLQRSINDLFRAIGEGDRSNSKEMANKLQTKFKETREAVQENMRHSATPNGALAAEIEGLKREIEEKNKLIKQTEDVIRAQHERLSEQTSIGQEVIMQQAKLGASERASGHHSASTGLLGKTSTSRQYAPHSSTPGSNQA